jgi:hypothetical protein
MKEDLRGHPYDSNEEMERTASAWMKRKKCGVLS